jgi:hypothetical protein
VLFLLCHLDDLIYHTIIHGLFGVEEEIPVSPALKVIRANDPWHGMSEEEVVEDAKEFRDLRIRHASHAWRFVIIIFPGVFAVARLTWHRCPILPQMLSSVVNRLPLSCTGRSSSAHCRCVSCKPRLPKR